MLRLLAFTVLMAATSVVEAQTYCNICGQNNTIQFPTGVVEFTYNGQKLKNNCQTWQKIVMNSNAITDSFCRNELLKYTVTVCKCTTPTGALLADTFVSPTTSPAPHAATSSPAPQASPAPPTPSKIASIATTSKVSNTTSASGNSSEQAALWWCSILVGLIFAS